MSQTLDTELLMSDVRNAIKRDAKRTSRYRNVSYREMQQFTGVSYMTFYRIEHRGGMSLHTLETICKALNLYPSSYFVIDKGE